MNQTLTAVPPVETEVAVKLIDCDVHGPVKPIDERLEDYIPEPWRSRYYKSFVGESEMNAPIYTPPTQAIRLDAMTPEGVSSPAWMDKQLLQEVGVDFAMLIFLQPRPKPANEEWESAIYAGHNAWLADSWLSRYNWHGRYRGAIRVSAFDADAAVEEIDKWAGHPYVAQIYITPESSTPYGHPRFHPIFDAAARHRLPITLHIIRAPGMRLLTPVGFPAYHIEIFPQWPLYFMGHIASMIFEGVFDKFPDLRIVCVEGGFAWLVPFLWRLDRHWRALGRPHVNRPPSEYVRQHFRFTTQPLDEPEPYTKLRSVMDWLPARDMLMFSTDYPHYDFDHPDWIGPRLPKDQRDRVMFENALELYNLPRSRPVDDLDRAKETLR